MVDKNFKTLDEQVEIYKKKGLIINDEKYTKHVLLRENYFFINGYRHVFYNSRDNKTFIKGTTFEELYSLFLFDRNIRNIIFKNILVIENNMKSIISYQLSKKYGYRESDYLRPRNFTQDASRQRQVNDLLQKMKRQIRINGPQHSATEHYSQGYGYIPLWILVKVLSFGIVSELYSILKDGDKKEIADIYGLDVDELSTYLPLLANYRNLCAHEDILYDNKTQIYIGDTIYHKLLDVPKDDNGYKYGKNDLFALIIIMKQMLSHEEFKLMVIELENRFNTLDYNLNTIKLEKIMQKMGFVLNWKKLVDIERSDDRNEEA